MGGLWTGFVTSVILVSCVGHHELFASAFSVACRSERTLFWSAPTENASSRVSSSDHGRPVFSVPKYLSSAPTRDEQAARAFFGAVTDRRRYVSQYCGMSGACLLQMNEKRYKEQLMGKKFRTVGRSSVRRHYRIQGRGGGLPRVRKATGLSANPIILPMRRCMLLGKMDNRKARSISHSGHRTHRIQRVNLAWKRLWWPEANHYVRLRLSMKGLKTIMKYGLQRAAEKFKLNLKDKRLFAGYSHRGKAPLEMGHNSPDLRAEENTAVVASVAPA